MINASQINPEILQRFRRLTANGRLAHAYLFVGPQDAGKTQTALALAQLVNCEHPSEGPCGQCAVCRKIDSGNHPDIHVLGSNEGESIKIEDIRFMLGRVRLKAYEARTKVFIIRNAELMTLEAANALLKTLEEPSSNTLIILTTSVPEASLETIRSRCHVIHFFPSPSNRVAGLLVEDGLSETEARFLAVYTEGCLGKARKLTGQGLLSRRREVLDAMLLDRNNDDFLKELASDRQQASEALLLALSFFRDAFLLKSGAPQSELVHQDRLRELNFFAVRSSEDLTATVRQIVQTKQLLDDNLSIKMSLNLLRERLWVK